MKAYKLRLYPNKEQVSKFEFALEMCRKTYNFLLSELNNQIQIDKSQIQGIIPDLKICEPELKQVYSKTLQYECYRLFSNLSALRQLKQNKKKVGRLRYKGRDWFKTFTYNQSGFKLIKRNSRYDLLHLSKIGNIKILQHREVLGTIKQIVIKRSCDKWYATIIADYKEQRICADKELGIDLGINHYLVDSEENYVEHPKFFEENKKLLRQACKNLSRKKLRSKNRLKARKILAKTYETISNKRDDFLHKLSTFYIRKSKIIFVEDLNIKQMMEQKYYNAKNIADSSWGR
ncbi:MAG: transposase, partial [Nanoarchaeota archaeon]|nr:transposase [Nanoarchaeota archaeon]